MFFASDNAGPAHPNVMQALQEANRGYALPYGAEPTMERVTALVRDIFEAPQAAVYLVATGTAANSLILATLAQPWSAIFCAPMAHIREDECCAPEFYTGGAQLTPIDAPDGKILADALRTEIATKASFGVRGPQPGPISITSVSELGTVYSLDEIAAIAAVARDFNLPLHLDGARLANALATLGCTPAEMTWKAGVDAVSFGGTKNGLLGAECVIFFDPAHAWEFELRRKRGAHLFSKHRYLSAQIEAYLTDDLWRELAQSANAACATLAAGLTKAGAEFLYQPEANIIFARWSRAAHRRLLNAGAVYGLMSGELTDGPDDEMLAARLVCDWSATPENTAQFLALLGG